MFYGTAAAKNVFLCHSGSQIDQDMNFEERLEWLKSQHEALITRKNTPIEGNGVYERYEHPILTDRKSTRLNSSHA